MGMPRHAKYKECLLKAQELFFPSLNSQYGKYSGMTLPQLYLVTKAKVQTSKYPSLSL